MHQRLKTRLMITLAVLFAAVIVHADSSVPSRRIGTSYRNQELRVSFRFRDVFKPSVRGKLSSGLPTNIILRLSLFRKGKSRPVALFPRTCQIVYDLWEEEFHVDIRDPNQEIHKRVRQEQQAIDLCGILDHTTVARELDSENYFIEAIAEANPLSPELLRNIKRWLNRPHGGSRSSAPGENFFGSFLSIFVNQRLGSAEAVVRFRSQTFSISR